MYNDHRSCLPQLPVLHRSIDCNGRYSFAPQSFLFCYTAQWIIVSGVVLHQLSPRHTGQRPRCDHGDLGNPPDHRVIAGYHKKAPLCDCNKDRAVLAWHSDARPLWSQLRFHCDLCVSATLIPQPHGAQDTRSMRPSVTLQPCHYNIGDRTTLLGRSHCVCWANTASIPRSYGDHRRFAVYLAPFHGKLECFQFIFFNTNRRFYILKANYDFIQVWIISAQISYNVNHKVIHGQYWKLHMIVLFRSSWHKYHSSFRFYRVNFCYW